MRTEEWRGVEVRSRPEWLVKVRIWGCGGAQRVIPLVAGGRGGEGQGCSAAVDEAVISRRGGCKGDEWREAKT